MAFSEPAKIAIPKATEKKSEAAPKAEDAAPIRGVEPPNADAEDNRHPVDKVSGILGWGGDTDAYLEEIRGRRITAEDGEVVILSVFQSPERTEAWKADERNRPEPEMERKAKAKNAAPVRGGEPPNAEGEDNRHPVERVRGILGRGGDTDAYLDRIRGRRC